ncbi:MAG: Gfo/Idh/MocA family oxidoreductase [Pseudomonadota bacterium]
MKLILVGPGAFGAKHLEALSNIDGAEIVSIVGPDPARSRALADRFGIRDTDVELAAALRRDGVAAAILTSPTALHSMQALECLDAGKHVAVEIPAGDNWPDVERLAAKQSQTGLVCMIGHTRRYNPSHQWIHQQVRSGAFSIQHMDVQTFFFRRTNTNALGEHRDWTDHLLWHHAAHSVDLFQYQTGETIEKASVMQGPKHPELGIAMDMSIQLQTVSGKLLTLALSFNNDGPLGTFFRYIGDTGTYIARYDELITGNDDPIDVSSVDVSTNGIEIQDRDFLNCIRSGEEPRASIANVLPCYRTLKTLEDQLNS